VAVECHSERSAITSIVQFLSRYPLIMVVCNTITNSNTTVTIISLPIIHNLTTIISMDTFCRMFQVLFHIWLVKNCNCKMRLCNRGSGRHGVLSSLGPAALVLIKPPCHLIPLLHITALASATAAFYSFPTDSVKQTQLNLPA
jgi:hypothetical protein